MYLKMRKTPQVDDSEVVMERTLIVLINDSSEEEDNGTRSFCIIMIYFKRKANKCVIFYVFLLNTEMQNERKKNVCT